MENKAGLPKKVKIRVGFMNHLGIERHKEYDVVPCPEKVKGEYGNHVWVLSDATGKPYLLQPYEYDAVKQESEKLKQLFTDLDDI